MASLMAWAESTLGQPGTIAAQEPTRQPEQTDSQPFERPDVQPPEIHQGIPQWDGTGSPFDAIREFDDQGREFWSARRLQEPLGYVEWRKFEDAIERATISCRNSGQNPGDHFGGAAKMVQVGSGANRSIEDCRLSRFGCYLVAMNGDPRKPEIAAAQQYFAIRTHQAEQAERLTHRRPTNDRIDPPPHMPSAVATSDHIGVMIQTIQQTLVVLSGHHQKLLDHDRRLDYVEQKAERVHEAASKLREDIAYFHGSKDNFYTIQEFARHISSYLGKDSRINERKELGTYFTRLCEDNGIEVLYGMRKTEAGYPVNGYKIGFLNSQKRHFDDFLGSREERAKLLPSLRDKIIPKDATFFPFVSEKVNGNIPYSGSRS